METITQVGTEPFGPTMMEYGPHDDLLYVVDAVGGGILRVNPDGTSESFAEIPLLPDGNHMINSPKALVADAEGSFGGKFLAATFTIGPEEGTDSIYAFSKAGEVLGNGVRYMGLPDCWQALLLSR